VLRHIVVLKDIYRLGNCYRR